VFHFHERRVTILPGPANLDVGGHAIRTPLLLGCLLLAGFCVPSLAGAQQPSHSPYIVSVRELTIPPKAFEAFQKGAMRLSKNDAAGSLPHFRRAVAEFPSYYEAYFEIGMANLQLSHVADAERALRKSVDLSDGNYAEPLFALGAVYIDQGKYSESVAVTRQALDLDPASWAGRYCLAFALLHINRLDEAEKSVREAIRQKPDSPESLLLLADIHHRRHNNIALVSDLDAYLQIAPDSPAATRVRALRAEAVRALAISSDSSALVPPRH
jgi:tetratricopeptide (TPR) repeat protein